MLSPHHSAIDLPAGGTVITPYHRQKAGRSQLKQHQAIAEKYVDDIKNFVQQVYPINDPDAYSVILNGLKDIFKGDIPAYYDTLRNKYHVEDPLTTYELLRQGVTGTKCQ